MENSLFQNNESISNHLFNKIRNIEDKRHNGYKLNLSNNNYSSRNSINKTNNQSSISNLAYTQEINPSFSYKLNNDQIKYNNQITNYELRKLIKKEFDSLYSPYHIEINNNFDRLRREINNIYDLNNRIEFNNLNHNKYEVEMTLNENKKNIRQIMKYLKNMIRK
jgi:hypothetical protein